MGLKTVLVRQHRLLYGKMQMEYWLLIFCGNSELGNSRSANHLVQQLGPGWQSVAALPVCMLQVTAFTGGNILRCYHSSLALISRCPG